MQLLLVLLHSQDDEPLVNDMGFTIGPGMHSLASLSYELEYFLEQPYGECGTRPLSYFGNVTYTYSRCKRECDIKKLERICNCTDAFMNGSRPVCTLDRYLDCVLAVRGDKQASNCDCLGACHVISYEPQLSYTSLSPISTNTLLDEHEAKVIRNYLAALEIRQRTKRDEMASVFRGLQKVIGMMQRAKASLEFEIFNESTSRLVRIDQALVQLIEQAERDVRIVYADCDDRQRAYAEELKPSREGLLRQLDALYAEYSVMPSVELHLLRIRGLASRRSDTVSRFLQLADGVRRAIDVLAAVNETYGLFTIRHDVIRRRTTESSLLPRVFVVPTSELRICVQNADSLIRNISEYAQSLTTMASTIESAGDDELIEDRIESWHDELRDAVPDIKRLSDSLASCLLQYDRFIGNAAVRASEDGIQASFRDLRPTRARLDWNRAVVQRFEREIRMLEELYDGYAAFRITKADLARTMNERITNDIESIFDGIRDQIRDTIEAPMMAKLSLVERILPDRYGTAFRDAATLQRYFSHERANAVFIERAGNASIWRRPYPDLQAEHLLQYAFLDQSVVPSTMPGVAEMFLDAKAEPLVADIVKSFLDVLRKAAKSLYSVVINKERTKIRQTLNDLIAQLMDYLADTRLNSDFVRSNFLQLDIYFPELKFLRTEQEVEYDMTTYWSDVGGYMGLLLGASVMSLAEIFDWMLFLPFKMRLHLGEETSQEDQTELTQSNNNTTFTNIKIMSTPRSIAGDSDNTYADVRPSLPETPRTYAALGPQTPTDSFHDSHYLTIE